MSVNRLVLVGTDETAGYTRSADLKLDTLLSTRLLIQAMSGAGKSFAARRLLEQSHGLVQHLVIDPEGEFASLRTKFDYVLAAKKEGDTLADPRSAKLLAERLLELGVSAILDIYELTYDQRISFVKTFLDTLVDAPKKLWHPVLVVLDEAHVFCPEKGSAESRSAVIDLATRGRKRGYCLVAATQRLSKFSKDAAAELGNKMIGRTTLDVDLQRAADELGMGKDKWATIRELDPGEFYAFGPAFTHVGVSRLKVGAVKTEHPKSGAHAAAVVPPPSDKVKAILSKIADLPAEAEQKAKTEQELRQEVATLKRELTLAKKQAGANIYGAPPILVQMPKRLSAIGQRVSAAIEEKKRQIQQLADAWARYAEVSATNTSLVEALEEVNKLMADLSVKGTLPPAYAVTIDGMDATEVARQLQAHVGHVSKANEAKLGPVISKMIDPNLSPVQRKILGALAELDQLNVLEPPREMVAFLSGYTNLNSKGFVNALGGLSTAGYVQYPSSGRVALTTTGRQAAPYPDAPRSPEDVQQRVIALLGGKSAEILRPLLKAYPQALPRKSVASAAHYENLNSKGFVNAIGRLRSLGFVRYPDRGTIAASPILFLEGP